MKGDKIVIDNVNKLLSHANNDESYRHNLSILVSHLKKKVGCSLLICETVGNDIDTGKWRVV